MLNETVVEARKGNGDRWKITVRDYYSAKNVFLAYNLIKSISTFFPQDFWADLHFSSLYHMPGNVCMCKCLFLF